MRGHTAPVCTMNFSTVEELNLENTLIYRGLSRMSEEMIVPLTVDGLPWFKFKRNRDVASLQFYGSD